MEKGMEVDSANAKRDATANQPKKLIPDTNLPEDYKESEQYAGYVAHVTKLVDVFHTRMNAMSMEIFGIGLERPKLEFRLQVKDTLIDAQYLPEENKIICYDGLLYGSYLVEKGHLDKGKQDTRLEETISHELGHELISMAFLSELGHPSGLLTGNPQRLRQVEEAAAELIGAYTTSQLTGMPTDNRSIALRMLAAIAEDCRYNADAIREYVADLGRAVEEMGYDAKMLLDYREIIVGSKEGFLLDDSLHRYPQVALCKALLANEGMPMQEFLLHLFQDPSSLSGMGPFLQSRTYLEEYNLSRAGELKMQSSIEAEEISNAQKARESELLSTGGQVPADFGIEEAHGRARFRVLKQLAEDIRAGFDSLASDCEETINTVSGKSHTIYGWDESEPQNNK